MIKFLNKKNNYDFIHQFQWINIHNKPKLNCLYIDNNNNSIIKKNNLIYPTYYFLLITFNQKPFIKSTKKSIASFNIRPNMNLGTFISINKNNYIWNYIFYFINPNLIKNNNNNNNNRNILYQYKNNKYHININYGINQSDSNFNNIKGGANLIYYFNSPIKYTPFYYLP